MIFYKDNTVVASEGHEELTEFLQSIGMNNPSMKDSMKLPPALLRRAKASGKATALEAVKATQTARKRRIDLFPTEPPPWEHSIMKINDQQPYNQLWFALEEAQSEVVWITTGYHSEYRLTKGHLLPLILKKVNSIVFYGDPDDRPPLESLGVPVITVANKEEAEIQAQRAGLLTIVGTAFSFLSSYPLSIL
jgi:hypothetical protein